MPSRESSIAIKAEKKKRARRGALAPNDGAKTKRTRRKDAGRD
jgi:hypothetical protein